MTIPVNYAQANFIYSGAMYPSGAQWTLGLNVTLYPGTAADAADDCRAAHVANLSPLQAQTCVFDSVLVKFGPDATGPSAVVASGTAGGVISAPAAPSTSILVRRNTSLGGRQGRGRIFFPGGADATFNDGGSLSSGDVAAVTAAFQAFAVDLVALDLVPVLLHADALTPTPIDSFSCQGFAANQRRRQRR